jgi:hypothetical protein
MSNIATKKHLPGITVDPNIPDFNKSPYAIKKAERARALIARHGLLKEGKPAKKGKSTVKKAN